MATTSLLTVAEFEAMALADATNGWELLWGEVRQMPSSGFEHSGIGMWIGYKFWQFVEPRDLGLVTGADGTFVLSREHKIVLVPDVAFVAKNRLPPADQRCGFFDGPPDLAAEILSPSDRLADVDEKARTWLRFGTRVVWIVHPGPQTVTVWTADGPPRVLGDTDQLDGGDVLPGFQIAVAELFR